MFQRDKETPQSRVHDGPVLWPIKNGLALGFGAITRIGFWLWYVIPISSFLIGDPFLGTLIYGIYSFTRGIAVWFIILFLAQHKNDWLVWLLQNRANLKIVSSVHLIVLAFLIIGIVGL